MRVLDWSDDRTILLFTDADALARIMSFKPKNNKRFIIKAEGWEGGVYVVQGKVITVC